jgi:uncharacterized membrane protein
MITTTLASGDLLDAIPSFWNDFRYPAAIVLIIAGVGAAIVSIHKGFGAAAGKLLGAIALASITLGAVGLTVSFEQTVNRHGGNVLTGQYGQ